ncbi:MFS transporter [Novosphingobium sp. 9]|uniref:MFS transporter n=1 Tax=Novosphingobium sp. 9 TaxID=2025349 RepID=UPI0021B6ACA7|nr:MFS transporter [Novosphingobium sp. 9]
MIPRTETAIEGWHIGSFQIRIAALCTLVAMLDGFDTQSIAYVAPRIAEDWGLGMSAFGPIFGIGLLGLTIGAFVMSPLADRFGRKIVLLGSVLMFGLFALATAAADSMTHLLVLRLLTGIGLGGAMPNIIALTNEYAPARSKATMVTVMFCGFPLGSTLGGLIAAPMIGAYGWHSVFVLGGILPLLVLPVLAFGIPESIRFLATRSNKEAQIARILSKIDPEASAAAFIANARSEARNTTTGFPVLELFRHGRARRTALVWTAFFMNLLVMYFLVNWLPSLLKAEGLPLRTAILSTALLNLGGAVGGVILGRLIDRMNPYIVLGSTYLFSALCVAGIAYAGTSAALVFAASAACGFGVSGAQIGLNAVTAESYPTAIRSTGIGWALGVGRVGSILGPLLGGMLLGAGWSAQMIILFAVAPALVSAAAVFSLRRI